MQLIAASTFADVFRPARGAAGWTYDVLLVVLGSALVALSAQLSVALPPSISPVPVTGQTFAILLVGALYGSKRGVATVLAYLAEGLVGLPVFAGGSGGAHHLLGPTGGYVHIRPRPCGAVHSGPRSVAWRRGRVIPKYTGPAPLVVSTGFVDRRR